MRNLNHYVLGILAVLTLITTLGCGKAGGAAPGLPAWADADQQVFDAGCISTAMNGSTVTNQQAVTYCQCILTVVMSRYSAANFNANSATDAAAVFNDGSTVSSCKAQAGR